MRHRVDHRKLGRTASHRKALMRSMVTSLFLSERITTTGPKAKEARRVAERLITRAKKGHKAHLEGVSLKSSGKEAEARQFESVALAHWRGAGSVVRSTDVLRKLFDQLAPHFMERNGGYTRIIRLDHRRVGDNAPLVLLELVDTEITKKPMIRGVVAAAAAAAKEAAAKDARPGKGRGKKKAESADESAKKEKKAKEKTKKDAGEKAAEKSRGKAARKGADAKKTAPAARSSKPKSTKKPGA